MTEALLPDPPIEDLDGYVASGGLSGLRTARSMEPNAVIDLIGHAGVRGRGGAGFPAARKWASVSASVGPDDDCFVVVNAAGCMTLMAVYPFTPLRSSWLYTTMASAAAGAQGIRDALDVLIERGADEP